MTGTPAKGTGLVKGAQKVREGAGTRKRERGKSIRRGAQFGGQRSVELVDGAELVGISFSASGWVLRGRDRGEVLEGAVPGASATAEAGRAGHWCCSGGHAGAAASADG